MIPCGDPERRAIAKARHLAHAEYGTLQNHLTEEELIEVFGLLGVPSDRFYAFRDHDCSYAPAWQCYNKPGSYCDLSWCRHGR